MGIEWARSLIRTGLLAALPMFGADVSPNARQIFDKQLDASEREVMALVETMPAKKFDFCVIGPQCRNLEGLNHGLLG